MISPAFEALKVHKQFILYRLSPNKTRPEKNDKLPCDASGRMVNAHDPTHWMTADVATSQVQKLGNNLGIGFVLTSDCKRFCLDIDNCLQLDNQWSQLAYQLCEMFPGAAVEVSASGRGLHVWGSYVGAMPSHSCKNEALGIELYTEKRFIALGRPDGASGNIDTDCTLALHSLIALYFPTNTEQSQALEWTTAPSANWRGPTDDNELIQRALRSKSAASVFGNKVTFADLWAANIPALKHSYPDPTRAYDASQADAALAQHLAFWTGKDCERIRRLMQGSALVREKWTRKDYLPRTILGAVGRQEQVLAEKTPTTLPPSLTIPSGTIDELRPEDFCAYLPTHSYINKRTREFHSAEAINGHLRRFSDSLGMKPAAWLDMFQFVHQLSWLPGQPEIVHGMIVENGHLRPDRQDLQPLPSIRCCCERSLSKPMA